MREILFRGKRKDNSEWIYGDLRQYNEKVFGIYSYNIKRTMDIIPKTTCQYTGLKDKNGKKIFEGDIVDCGNCEDFPRFFDTKILNVKFVAEHAGFSPFCFYDSDFGEYVFPDHVEVIGNIYDNPELLKDVENEFTCI